MILHQAKHLGIFTGQKPNLLASQDPLHSYVNNLLMHKHFLRFSCTSQWLSFQVPFSKDFVSLTENFCEFDPPFVAPSTASNHNYKRKWYCLGRLSCEALYAWN